MSKTVRAADSSGTLAAPFVLLAALDKLQEFAACLFEAVAWFLINLL
jgi:hypothetical protein